MNWLDLPPLWLAAFVVAAWGIGWLLPGFVVGFPWLFMPGAALILAGLGLMLAAVVPMRRQRTTVIPRRQPSALVRTGVFSLTRNPIYLGDALILTGVIVFWGISLALLLVPLFMWVINRRFIMAEEARLHANFGAEFTAWAEKTPRWL